MADTLLLSDQPLDVALALDQAAAPEAGAIDVFVGTVRNQTAGRSVTRLEFEAYEAMALSELQKIVVQARAQWPICRIAVHHRVGVATVGELAVVIAVSTPHREAAFAACRYLIDTLKQTVPIWKREVFTDGAEWVTPTP